MHWGHPEILYGVFALPLLAFFFWWAQRRRRRLLERFGRWTTIAGLLDSASTRRQVAKMALLALAFVLLIVALARPQYGRSERKIARRGIDVLVAVDVSNSMRAADVGQSRSRLARAKEQLRQLLLHARGHRMGILAFAGNAFVQCPLTLDYALALRILDAVEVGLIPEQGTSIGAAIEAAVDAFERAEGSGKDGRKAPTSERVLLLLTDGEDHEQEELNAAVERAAKAGVRIFAIGIGSESGTTIRLPDGRVHKDPEGRVVQTRLDYATLQRIAAATGGVAIRGTASGDLDVAAAQRELDAMRQTVQRSATRVVYTERFIPILAAAAFVLLVELFAGDRRKRRTAVAAQKSAAASDVKEAA